MRVKTLIICALLALTTIFSGCTKSTWERPSIDFGNLKPNSVIDIDMAGGSVTVTMKATRDWKIDSVQAWTGISKEKGTASTKYESITIAAPENPGYNRYAYLVFKAGPVKEYLTIRQEGPDGEDDGIQDATIAEVIAEANTTQCYRISGTVSNFYSTYCSFDITDDTGSIYVFSVTTATKTQYASILKNNDKVTLEGYYYYYSAKSKHEFINATIVSHTPAN